MSRIDWCNPLQRQTKNHCIMRLFLINSSASLYNAILRHPQIHATVTMTSTYRQKINLKIPSNSTQHGGASRRCSTQHLFLTKYQLKPNTSATTRDRRTNSRDVNRDTRQAYHSTQTVDLGILIETSETHACKLTPMCSHGSPKTCRAQTPSFSITRLMYICT